MELYSATIFEWEKVILFRLMIAVILGACIGMERERKNRFAGFRTHILVAVGSCVFMLVSLSMPMIVAGLPVAGIVNNADPGRIAAQVVSGIGFLGAGAILQSKRRVKGLTTAASLWAMAAIGLAVGSGLYLTGITATIVILLVLTYFTRLETKTRQKKFALLSEESKLEEQLELADIITQLVEDYGIRLNNVTCIETDPQDNKKKKEHGE